MRARRAPVRGRGGARPRRRPKGDLARRLGALLRLSVEIGAAPDEGAICRSVVQGLHEGHQGRLVLCQHGNRRIARLEPDGSVTSLADRYEGKRLNSPNDLVYKMDGAL